MSEQLVVTARRVRNAYLTMLISASLSLFAAMVLSIDAFKLAKDENVDLSCSINAVVSCGKVALSWQSTVFGFPNSFIGLMFESAVITIAIAGLMQVRFPNSLIRIAFFIYSAALIFALWLFSQSFFVIKAFCPWCMLVTVSTISVFMSMLRINIYQNAFNWSEVIHQKILRLILLGRDYAAMTIVYAVIASAIIWKYGTYFLPEFLYN
ncbi:MAG: vitamin K epoxide reductase [Actinobacteria bacterium]|jgi:uncharacterized membrane protein|uniref:Unannotated protein n=1 Tax=freshwater metagenome TaxID=449393 RepID=A0A6J6DS89_9ZZZZ|nr:vitamin K epoxide reductase [Actinomycetota bacterium]